MLSVAIRGEIKITLFYTTKAYEGPRSTDPVINFGSRFLHLQKMVENLKIVDFRILLAWLFRPLPSSPTSSAAATAAAAGAASSYSVLVTGIKKFY